MLNKRGMFFILLSILLITFFLVSVSLYSGFKERASIQRRVETLNNFVFAAEEDLERRMFISGFRVIFLFEEEIIEEGAFLDVEDSFQELFYNGSLGGDLEVLMVGATFPEMEDIIREKANKMGANFSFTRYNASIGQSDPWNVDFVLDVDYILEDVGGLVEWNRSLIVDVSVPIEGFGDPLYLVNTNSLVFGNITKTPYTDFVDAGDTSNLNAHLLGPFYINNTDAPSFLDRFEASPGASVNGIESLVNLNTLASLGIPIEDKTVVDHIYFSSSNAGCPITESGMPSWFRLDSGHESLYEASCA